VAKKENSVILLEDNYSTTYEGFDPNSSESYIMFELVQDVYMDQSLSFADDVQRQFKSKLEGSNRGVKQAGFLVLRQSSMPSVLIETGFISNPAEANYLMSDQGEFNIAHSILEAFRKFKSKSTGQKQTFTASLTPVAGKNEVHTTRPDSAQKHEKTLVIQDTLPKEKPVVKEEEKKAEMVVEETHTKKQEIPTENLKSASSDATKAVPDVNTYFSVQIGASTTSVEPVAANFKGLKNVRVEKADKYYRYFVGKESSIEQITPLWVQIKQKFPQAFIVSFIAGKRIIPKIDTK